MKRIIIISEGETEIKFCKEVLRPYFSINQIDIFTKTINKTGGGIVNWEALKHQIADQLKRDKTAIVTTLIDFYGIHQHHKYPYWLEAKTKVNKSDGIKLIEDGMKADIGEPLNYRFIPYIQLHEFEAILFSDRSVFDIIIKPYEFLDKRYLDETINKHPNPEDINDGKESAPSKRLSKIIKEYNKVMRGTELAQAIGLEKIREKCPRFNEWILNIENI